MALFLGDCAVLFISLGVMLLIRFPVNTCDAVTAQLSLFLTLFAIWLIVFFVFDLYNLRRVNPTPRTIGLLIAAMGTNFLLGLAFFYLIPAAVTPKTNLALVAGGALLLLIAWRRLFFHLFTVRFARSIGLIGTHPLLAELSAELGKHPQLGSVAWHHETFPNEFPAPADVLVAESVAPYPLLLLAQRLDAEPLSLLAAYETLFGKIPLSLMTDGHALQLLSRKSHPGVHFVTRIIEITIAVLVLVATSPLLLIAMVGRLIEDGSPIFYSQTRVGENGRLFSIYKIRSMKKNAEAGGAQWAQKGDARITGFGAFLRKTHIDEIPQMWNVIKGNIALVGPRPERPEFVTELETQIPYYFLRHSVRPGFTGWAQIKYRYASTVLDSKEKFEYDLYYLNNKHPLLDIGIAIKTLQIIFTH